MNATVTIESGNGIMPDPTEIREGQRVIEILKRGDLWEIDRIAYDIKFNLDRVTIDEIELGFNQRLVAIDGVLQAIGADGALAQEIISALAVFALVAAVSADSNQFHRGEFCILPFWPFC